MKKTKLFIQLSLLVFVGLVGIAADHIDAPSVQGGTSDITDFYAFQGEDTDNLVFVANLLRSMVKKCNPSIHKEQIIVTSPSPSGNHGRIYPGNHLSLP